MTTYTPSFQLPKPESSEPPDGPAHIGALADAVDTALESVNTRTTAGASNGGASVAIPNGNTWTDTPDEQVQITTTGPGLLIVNAVVTMNDPGATAGDPEARLDIAGPVGTVVTNVAKIGISAGDGDISATAPVHALVPVTAAGTVTITRQVRHTVAAGTNGSYYSFDVHWILIAEQ